MEPPDDRNGHITVNVASTFGEFYGGWADRHRELTELLFQTLQQRSTVSGVDRDMSTKKMDDLIQEVMFHYKRYFEKKSEAAKQDVFLFFSPPWMSSLERTLLWLGEFKPSMVFRFVDATVKDLTEEQRERIERVRGWARREERALNDRMVRVQESVAAPPVLSVLRQMSRREPDGEEGARVEEVTGRLRVAMLDVMMTADELRGTTVAEVVHVLRSDQSLAMLAAAGRFQVEMRRRGLERDAHRNYPGGDVGAG